MVLVHDYFHIAHYTNSQYHEDIVFLEEATIQTQGVLEPIWASSGTRQEYNLDRPTIQK